MGDHLKTLETTAKRMRLARTGNTADLRCLLMARLTSRGRLELVYDDGSRHPIAVRLDEDALVWLVQATRPGSNARLELVFPSRVPEKQ